MQIVTVLHTIAQTLQYENQQVPKQTVIVLHTIPCVSKYELAVHPCVEGLCLQICTVLDKAYYCTLEPAYIL